MKLKFIHMAENAFTDSEGKLNITQIFDNIKTPGFPAMHPQITIITRWEFEKGENAAKKKGHKQSIEIVSKKSGQQILKTPDFELEAEPDKTDYLQYIVNLQGVKFDESGTYEIIVRLDEDLMEKMTFKVLKE